MLKNPKGRIIVLDMIALPVVNIAVSFYIIFLWFSPALSDISRSSNVIDQTSSKNWTAIFFVASIILGISLLCVINVFSAKSFYKKYKELSLKKSYGVVYCILNLYPAVQTVLFNLAILLIFFADVIYDLIRFGQVR